MHIALIHALNHRDSRITDGKRAFLSFSSVLLMRKSCLRRRAHENAHA